MRGAFKIARVLDIEVKVHWTFFLLLVFFGAAGYAQTGKLLGVVLGVGLILMLFAFVLLHEYGHALVARRLGAGMRDIVLLPLGGMARMKTLPERPWDEVKIAAAGPPVNVLLSALFYGAAYLGYGVSPLAVFDLGAAGGSAGNLLSYLGLINLILAVFNMLPAFPMDGGRVLRGLLWTRMGRVRATEVAALIGRGFALGFFLIGLLGGNFLLALVAVFIFFGAAGETQMVRQRELMRGLLVSDVMGKRPHLETVTPYHTFGQVLEQVLHGYQEDFPVVDEDGRLVGMITRNEIMASAHSPERYSSVRDLMKTEFPTISPEADLFTDGARILQESGLRALPVVEYGKLVGMLTMHDVRQASLLERYSGKGV